MSHVDFKIGIPHFSGTIVTARNSNYTINKAILDILDGAISFISKAEGYKLLTTVKIEDNDGKLDNYGKLYIGTMDREEKNFNGNIFCYENNYLEIIKSNIGISNGISFDNQNKMYSLLQKYKPNIPPILSAAKFLYPAFFEADKNPSTNFSVISVSLLKKPSSERIFKVAIPAATAIGLPDKVPA